MEQGQQLQGQGQGQIQGQGQGQGQGPGQGQVHSGQGGQRNQTSSSMSTPSPSPSSSGIAGPSRAPGRGTSVPVPMSVTNQDVTAANVNAYFNNSPYANGDSKIRIDDIRQNVQGSSTSGQAMAASMNPYPSIGQVQGMSGNGGDYSGFQGGYPMMGMGGIGGIGGMGGMGPGNGPGGMGMGMGIDMGRRPMLHGMSQGNFNGIPQFGGTAAEMFRAETHLTVIEREARMRGIPTQDPNDERIFILFGKSVQGTSSQSYSGEYDRDKSYDVTHTGSNSETFTHILGQKYVTMSPAFVWFEERMKFWNAEFQRDVVNLFTLERQGNMGEAALFRQRVDNNPSKNWESFKKEFLARFRNFLPVQTIAIELSKIRLTKSKSGTVGEVVDNLEKLWSCLQVPPSETEKATQMLVALDDHTIQTALYDVQGRTLDGTNQSRALTPSEILRVATAKEHSMRATNVWPYPHVEGNTSTSSKKTGGRHNSDKGGSGINAVQSNTRINRSWKKDGKDKDSSSDISLTELFEGVSKVVSTSVSQAIEKAMDKSFSKFMGNQKSFPPKGEDSNRKSSSSGQLEQSSSSSPLALRNGKKRLSCFECGKTDHIARDCPIRKAKFAKEAKEGKRRDWKKGDSKVNFAEEEENSDVDMEDDGDIYEVEEENVDDEDAPTEDGYDVNLVDVIYLLDEKDVNDNANIMNVSSSAQPTGILINASKEHKVSSKGKVKLPKGREKFIPTQMITKVKGDDTGDLLYAIVDPGAGATLMSKQRYTRLPKELRKSMNPLDSKFDRSFSSASNGKLIPIGTIGLELIVENTTLRTIEFVVVKNLFCDALIGTDVLSDQEMFGPLDLPNRCLIYQKDGELLSLPLVVTLEELNYESKKLGGTKTNYKRRGSRSANTVEDSEDLEESMYHFGSISVTRDIEIPPSVVHGGKKETVELEVSPPLVEIKGLKYFQSNFPDKVENPPAGILSISRHSDFNSAVHVMESKSRIEKSFLKGQKSMSLKFLNSSSQPIRVPAGTKVAKVDIMWKSQSTGRAHVVQSFSITSQLKKVAKRKEERMESEDSQHGESFMEDSQSPFVVGDEENYIGELDYSSEKVEQKAMEEMLSAVVDKVDHKAIGIHKREKEDLRDLLISFSDCFAINPNKPTTTQIVMHEIDTGDSKPIGQKPRPIAKALEERIYAMIMDMERDGIITKTNSSAWASPLTPVPKKDGGIRFCIDYRNLNKVTKTSSYPIPRVQDLLDCFHGAKYFSTIDLASGYWQIQMDPNSKEKTTFTSKWGTWYFNVMPFGLNTAPATFQSLMDKIFSEMRWKFIANYFDDIAIFSQTYKQHLRHLRKVLEKLREFQLQAKLTKCHFVTENITFLGHVLSANGISPDKGKISAITNWARPNDKRGVRSFIGLCSYYRKFIPHFSTIAAPLHRLQSVSKDIIFEWGPKEQEAFDKMKEAMSSPPVLIPPNWDEPFLLQTDASDVGVGAVLSQIIDGEERAIAFASKSLNAAQKNYTTTDKECLAIVWGVRNFRIYLLGKRFTLQTDHSALQFLNTMRLNRDLTGRLARYQMFLQEYDFVILYRKGKENINADALSRDPERIEMSDEEENNINVIGGDIHQQSPNIQGRSQEDFKERPSVSEIREALLPAKVIDYIKELPSTEEFKLFQQEDPVLKPICLIVSQKVEEEKKRRSEEKQRISKDGKVSEPLTEVLVKGKNYSFDVDGLLQIRRHFNWEVFWVIVIPEKMKHLILFHMHADPTSGHLGVYKTYGRISMRYWWKGYFKDVENYVVSCPRCASRKSPKKPASFPVITNIPEGAPWSDISYDAMGPLPTTERGNNHIVSFACRLTKNIELFAVPDLRETTIANLFIDEIVPRHGCPKFVLSDRAASFNSGVLNQIYTVMGSIKLTTSAYNPQSNGMVERDNETIAAMLTPYVHYDQKNWDQNLGTLAGAYRSSPHAATGYTPNYMEYGRELRLPVENIVGAKTIYWDQQDYLSEKLKRISLSWDIARARLLDRKLRLEEKSDAETFRIHYEEGQKVYVFVPDSSGRKKISQKLLSRWQGPFVVLERTSVVTYRVARKYDDGTTESRVVNVRRMKPYTEPNGTSMMAHQLEDRRREKISKLYPSAISHSNEQLQIQPSQPDGQGIVNPDDPSDLVEIIPPQGESIPSQNVPMIDNNPPILQENKVEQKQEFKFENPPSLPVIEAEGEEEEGKKERKNQYEVDKIVDIGRAKDGNEDWYLVKWVGFSNSFNTWEPLSNLLDDGCQIHIEEFQKKKSEWERKKGKEWEKKVLVTANDIPAVLPSPSVPANVPKKGRPKGRKRGSKGRPKKSH
jgi:hypothetical protein